MRMARTVSVTRSRDSHGRDAGDEARSSGFVVAHASAAVPRPGERALRPPLDAPACAEGLLGHGEMLREFPDFHATFNVLPSLSMQLEEYASGNFNEPWFSLAFKHSDDLT